MIQQDISDLLKILLAAYPTQKARMSDEQIVSMARIYWAGLRDIELVAIKLAVNKLIKTAKFIPTIAEIREAVGGSVATGEVKPAGLAWGEALELVRRYGVHRAPGIDFQIADSLLAATLKAFGWRSLCSSENQTADRARFIELYEQLSTSHRRQLAVSSGAGSSGAPALPSFDAHRGDARSLADSLPKLPAVGEP